MDDETGGNDGHQSQTKSVVVSVLILVIILIIIFAAVYYQYQSPSQPSATGQTQAQSSNQLSNQSGESLAQLNAEFTPAALQDATYTFAGDTFTLANGGQVAIQQGHTDYSSTDPSKSASYYATSSTPLSPVGYQFATSTAGDIGIDPTTASTTQGAIVAMYRSWGANIIMPVLFAVINTNPADPSAGAIQQIATGIVNNQEDAQIQSVSVAQGVITLNLLVVSAQDQQTLPHYQWTPNQPLTLTFKIVGDQLMAQ